jgi:hypothetical protein
MTARTAAGPVAALAGGLGLAAIAWLGAPAPGTPEFALRAAQHIGDDPEKPLEYFKDGGNSRKGKKADRDEPEPVDAEPDPLRTDDPRVPDTVQIDAAAITAALDQLRTELDACGRAAQAQKPDLPAEVTWTLHATPDGAGASTVRSVSSAQGRVLDDCASAVLGGMRFASPNTLELETTWTFAR